MLLYTKTARPKAPKRRSREGERTPVPDDDDTGPADRWRCRDDRRMQLLVRRRPRRKTGTAARLLTRSAVRKR